MLPFKALSQYKHIQINVNQSTKELHVLAKDNNLDWELLGIYEHILHHIDKAHRFHKSTVDEIEHLKERIAQRELNIKAKTEKHTALLMSLNRK